MTVAMDRAARAVDRLEPIGLEELIARAGLLTRVDRKYAVTGADLEMVLELAPDGTRVLDIACERSFDYASTYLDTPDLDTFHGAAHRRRRRFKVRTRTYLSSGEEYLEVKTRSGAATVKSRLAGRHTDGGRLTATGADFVGSTLLHAGIDPGPVERLGPVLTTEYRRTTLLLADQASRVTVDTGLRWHALTGGHALGLPELGIIETKSAGRVSEMDRLLWSLGIRPARISKFATGLAALHSDLPRNRWTRTLRRHF